MQSFQFPIAIVLTLVTTYCGYISVLNVRLAQQSLVISTNLYQSHTICLLVYMTSLGKPWMLWDRNSVYMVCNIRDTGSVIGIATEASKHISQQAST